MNSTHARRVYFQQIKQSVAITQILERYNIEVKKVGAELKGCRPIHNGSHDRQFVVSPSKGLFHCFAPKCGAGGDVVQLVAYLERTDVKTARMSRQVMDSVFMWLASRAIRK